MVGAIHLFRTVKFPQGEGAELQFRRIVLAASVEARDPPVDRPAPSGPLVPPRRGDQRRGQVVRWRLAGKAMRERCLVVEDKPRAEANEAVGVRAWVVSRSLAGGEAQQAASMREVLVQPAALWVPAAARELAVHSVLTRQMAPPVPRAMHVFLDFAQTVFAARVLVLADASRAQHQRLERATGCVVRLGRKRILTMTAPKTQRIPVGGTERVMESDRVDCNQLECFAEALRVRDHHLLRANATAAERALLVRTFQPVLGILPADQPQRVVRLA